MQTGYKILCMGIPSFAREAIDILNKSGDVKYENPSQERFLEFIPQFDAYFASLEVLVDRAALDRAKNLKVIATPSTGTDHLDMEYASERGITVLSLKEDYEFLKNITATAEMAWTLLLSVIRKVPWGFDSVKSGEWGRDRFRGHQLSGKTMGILGYGRLGKIVAQYAAAFRMRIIACDLKRIDNPDVIQVDMDTLLGKSDVLSIHIHLTEDNRGIMDRMAFSKMKPGVVLINTSRGAVIDEPALVEALESGIVGAAGLDVITGEWEENLADHPLIRYASVNDNLLISPHLGGVTYESQEMAYNRTAFHLASYLAKIKIKYHH